MMRSIISWAKFLLRRDYWKSNRWMSTLGCGSCKKCRRQLRLLVKWDEISVGGGCCRSYSMLRSKKRIQAIVVVVVILRRLNCASIRLAARALSPCRFSATTPPRQKAHMLFNRHQVKRLRWSHASGSGQNFDAHSTKRFEEQNE